MSGIREDNDLKHEQLVTQLEAHTDQHFCISIIGDDVYADIEVSGFTEKVAIITEIEKYLKALKQS
jgi:hypothetical protein